MKVVYINPEAVSQSKKDAAEWFTELDPFIQEVLKQVFKMSKIDYNSIEAVYKQREEFLKNLNL